MSEYKEIIFDAKTGEKTERFYTEQEIAELEAAAARAEEERAAAEAEAQVKAAAKQSAQDKLKALGLSDIEIAALIGA